MRFIQFFSLVMGLAVSSTTVAQVLFNEQASALGCAGVTYGNGTLGGGISFFDFDNDGWDDITVTSEANSPVRFFKNEQGAFSEVTFNMVQNLGEVKSAVWVDYDNDGDNDFHISSNTHPNQLFENTGNMQFIDVTAAAGMDLPSDRSWGASWGDFDKDGWLDLFQSSRELNSAQDHNRLYRNNQDGTFTDVTIPAGISTDDRLSFCAAFFDYNNDGWPDIYIANDRPWFPNILYRNNGDGTYTDVSAGSGTDIGINAMSTAIGDYDNDGWFDIYVTNTPEGNAFLRNNGDNTFSDVAAVNGTLMETIAWGAVYLDADNDQDLDLYVSSSWTDPQVHLTSAFYENDGSGNYTIPNNAGFENDDVISYANAIGDVNNDGYPDIVVLNFAPADIFIWKNECPATNHWLKIKLQGVESNRMGVGSLIELSINGEKQYNYTLCGEGYLGQNSAYEFFGIGTATQIDYIQVTWPSGVVDLVIEPQIDQAMTLVEGSTLGLNEVAILNKIIVAPNPVFEITTLKVASEFVGMNYKLLDALGRSLLDGSITSEETNLDLSSLSKGLYFLSIQGDRALITQKLVIE